MKSAFLSATFPELPGSRCHHEARGRGSSKKVAISRAIGALLKKTGRYRWSTIQLVVNVIDMPEDNPKPKGE